MRTEDIKDLENMACTIINVGCEKLRAHLRGDELSPQRRLPHILLAPVCSLTINPRCRHSKYNNHNHFDRIFVASTMATNIATQLDHSDNKLHLLLAASGSVATIKIANIIQAFRNQTNLSIRVILTESAAHFLVGQSHEQPTINEIFAMPNVDGIYQDKDEWTKPWVRGDKILHIELRRWADILVIAPLSANTLAKMVHGMSDNLLLSTIRAWDTSGLLDPIRVPANTDNRNERPEMEQSADTTPNKKIIIVAPAMNTAMWFHPVTAQQIRVLEEDWGINHGGWVQVLRPVEKVLACGDVGSGAMKEWTEIVKVIEEKLGLGRIEPELPRP